MPGQPHVVILGAGFAGVGALKRLRDADVRITLISKHDYQTFQPLIYQVATAAVRMVDATTPQDKARAPDKTPSKSPAKTISLTLNKDVVSQNTVEVSPGCSGWLHGGPCHAGTARHRGEPD